jgi:hypothetical protein
MFRNYAKEIDLNLGSYLVETAWITIRKMPEMQEYYQKYQGKKCKEYYSESCS